MTNTDVNLKLNYHLGMINGIASSHFLDLIKNIYYGNDRKNLNKILVSMGSVLFLKNNKVLQLQERESLNGMNLFNDFFEKWYDTLGGF